MDGDTSYFYVLDQQGGAQYISDWDAAKYDAQAKGTYPSGVFQSWVGIKLKFADHKAVQDNINCVAKDNRLVIEPKQTTDQIYDENVARNLKESSQARRKINKSNTRKSKTAGDSAQLDSESVEEEQRLQLQQERQERQERLEIDVALLKKEVLSINEKIQSSIKNLINELTDISVAMASEAKQTQIEQARKRVIDQLINIFDVSRELTEISVEISQSRVNIWEDLSANDVYQQRYKDYVDCMEIQNDRIVSLLNSVQISNMEAQDVVQKAIKEQNDLSKTITMIVETLANAQKNYDFIYRNLKEN